MQMLNSEEVIEARGGAQSKAFMIDLLPYIWAHFRRYPRGTSFTALDVGPGAAFGSELLASLHASSFLGYPTAVDVIDVNRTYEHLIRTKHHFIRRAIFGNIYELETKYDIVICSAVIEHVPEPLRFVRRLQAVAKQKVFVLAPFEEDPNVMAAGHINRFDYDFLANFEKHECHLIESIAWGAFMRPPWKTMILCLRPMPELFETDTMESRRLTVGKTPFERAAPSD
jgi:hypothetical protein